MTPVEQFLASDIIKLVRPILHKIIEKFNWLN